MSRSLQQRPTQRPAFVMIAVLVLLVVTTALATCWTTDVLRERRQVGVELMRRQAKRLGEAAIARALVQLVGDPDYTGEVWRLSESDLGQTYDAEVAIRVEPATGEESWQIIAQTKLPAGPSPRVRHTMTQVIPNSSDSTSRAGDPAP